MSKYLSHIMSTQDIMENADVAIESLRDFVEKFTTALNGQQIPEPLNDYEVRIREARTLLSRIKFKQDIHTPSIASALKNFVQVTRKLRGCFGDDESHITLTDQQVRDIISYMGDLNQAKEYLQSLHPGTSITAQGNTAVRSFQSNAPLGSLGSLGRERLHSTAISNRVTDGVQINSLINGDPGFLGNFPVGPVTTVAQRNAQTDSDAEDTVVQGDARTDSDVEEED
ncbi:hypothetical protein F5Y12DRAFT_781208 [Xylaria sp. FL1777]|nr:hypothetical protein F5Y12DRAFT_781208 [Xylaria sp. FL1777]